MVRLIGEVFDYLVAHGRMKEKEARAKFRQVPRNVYDWLNRRLCNECIQSHNWS